MASMPEGEQYPHFVLAPDGVFIPQETFVPEPQLANYLGRFNESERMSVLVNIIRVGLTLKLNDQMQQLNEALVGVANLTVEKFQTEAHATMSAMAAQAGELRQTLGELLRTSVTGDDSAFKASVRQAVQQLEKGLEHQIVEVEKALDPANVKSVGAKLEQRLSEAFQGYISRVVTPQISEVAHAVQRLSQALADEKQLKAIKNRSTQKGADYETALLALIQTLVVPGAAYVERIGNVKAVDGSKHGDLLISFNDTPLVVIECKDAKNWDLDDLTKAMAARKAPVGILATKDPTGPAQGMPPGSVRLIADNRLLLVWNPNSDTTGVLVATVGLAFALAKALNEAKMDPHEGINMVQAQVHLNQLVGSLSATEEVVSQFASIIRAAEKGKKAVDNLKQEWVQQIEGIFKSLGLPPGR